MGSSKGFLETHRGLFGVQWVGIGWASFDGQGVWCGCRVWGSGLGCREWKMSAGDRAWGSSFQMQGGRLRCMGGVWVKGVAFKISVLGCTRQGFAGQYCVWGSVLECKEDQFWGCQGCRGIALGRSRFQGLTSHNSWPCCQRRGPRRAPARASAPCTAPRCRRQPGQGPPSARSRPPSDTSDPGVGQEVSETPPETSPAPIGTHLRHTSTLLQGSSIS